MSYLLDTNVLSELRKRQPDSAVVAWIESVASEELHISVLVLGEISQGIERLRRRDPHQAERLDSWRADIQEAFEERLLSVDLRVAYYWGKLNARVRTLPAVDGLMLATAGRHGLAFVTRDEPLVDTGVPILNPWSAQ